VGHIAAFSRPPTVQEITDALNIGSKSTTAADLAWLEAQGRITVDRGVARGITVLTR
jgi:SOS-response transcriptional repressor LexA